MQIIKSISCFFLTYVVAKVSFLEDVYVFTSDTQSLSFAVGYRKCDMELLLNITNCKFIIVCVYTHTCTCTYAWYGMSAGPV